MSESGTFQTCVAKLTMSAHGGEADLAIATTDFRFWRRSQPIDATLYLRGKRWSV